MRKAKIVNIFCDQYEKGDIVDVLTYDEIVKLPNINEFMEKLRIFGEYFPGVEKEKLLYVVRPNHNMEDFFITDCFNLDFDIEANNKIEAKRKLIKLNSKCPFMEIDKNEIYKIYSYHEIMTDKELSSTNKDAIGIMGLFQTAHNFFEEPPEKMMYIKARVGKAPVEVRNIATGRPMKDGSIVVGYPVLKSWYQEVENEETKKNNTVQFKKRKLVTIKDGSTLVLMGILSQSKFYVLYTGEEILSQKEICPETKKTIKECHAENKMYIVEKDIMTGRNMPWPVHEYEYTVVAETTMKNF